MSNSQSIGIAYSDQAIVAGTIDGSVIGGTTPAVATFTTCYASQELGYSSAAQGTVTQATSKSTGVTLSKSAGQITMDAAALGATTNVTFTLTNTLLSLKEVVIVNGLG